VLAPGRGGSRDGGKSEGRGRGGEGGTRRRRRSTASNIRGWSLKRDWGEVRKRGGHGGKRGSPTGEKRGKRQRKKGEKGKVRDNVTVKPLDAGYAITEGGKMLFGKKED